MSIRDEENSLVPELTALSIGRIITRTYSSSKSESLFNHLDLIILFLKGVNTLHKFAD